MLRRRSEFASDRRPAEAIQGLEYFAENSKLEFVLAVEEFPKDSEDEIQMATSTEDTAPHTRWGQLTFEVDGVPVALTPYRSAGGGDYFLPFMDDTSGDRSYTDGRYLYLPASGDGRLLVGFNYAYNAYCAYNPHWSCPTPTSENRLTPKIDAGKKTFPDAEGHERH